MLTRDSELWAASGHLQHYAEDMFIFDVDKEKFGLKVSKTKPPLFRRHSIFGGDMLMSLSANELPRYEE